jgi:hypothetical protein
MSHDRSTMLPATFNQHVWMVKGGRKATLAEALIQLKTPVVMPLTADCHCGGILVR